ncbi:MAG: carotenoid biosynthesis protein [Ferruginibacter sp.]
MFLLLLYTQKNINRGMLLFTLVCLLGGIAVEIIGTKTGWIFGDYKYGNVLGPSIEKVPYVIGVNWFIVIYCSGVTIQILLNAILDRLPYDAEHPRPSLKALSIVADGATLAVLFDWLMEPVASKLGYWQWDSILGTPFYNYLCWFLVASLMLLVFHFAKFEKHNKFAVNLLLIQAMFFLLLRTFL